MIYLSNYRAEFIVMSFKQIVYYPSPSEVALPAVEAAGPRGEVENPGGDVALPEGDGVCADDEVACVARFTR